MSNRFKAVLLAVAGAVLALVASLASAGAAVPKDHTVYVLGDSYTVLMQAQGLDTSLGPDWKISSSGRGGRNIGVDPTLTGIQQITKDKALVAASGTVVIELGTNLGDGTYFISRMHTLVNQIRSINSTVRILWVEPANFVTEKNGQSKLRQRVADMNAQVAAFQTSTSKFEIVHWQALAFANPQWFDADVDHKHPDVNGTQALIRLIDQAILPPIVVPTPTPTETPAPTETATPTPTPCVVVQS